MPLLNIDQEGPGDNHQVEPEPDHHGQRVAPLLLYSQGPRPRKISGRKIVARYSALPSTSLRADCWRPSAQSWTYWLTQACGGYYWKYGPEPEIDTDRRQCDPGGADLAGLFR